MPMPTPPEATEAPAESTPTSVDEVTSQLAASTLAVTNPEEEESKDSAAQGTPVEVDENRLTATQITTAKPNMSSVVRNFNVNNLETFQKYKILGDKNQAAMLKKIFVNYVCVGDNIFSTTCHDDKIDFETKNPFFGRKFTILI